MYNYKVATKNTKTSEHLDEKNFQGIDTFASGQTNFNEPWKKDLPYLTEEEYKELMEKGKLVKTELLKKTTFIEKANR